MDKQVLCIWDVTNKPWIRVGLRNIEDDLPESETVGELSLCLRARLYLPGCCSDPILSRVLNEIADFNLRYKHFTDLFVIDAATVENTARNIAHALLGDYHSVLMREAEVNRRERSLDNVECIRKTTLFGTEPIYVAFHWDSEWGIEAVGAYRDREVAELECRMLALDCKYAYQRVYRSEFSLHGEIFGSDFFEKGGSGWNILDSVGKPAHKFRVEAVNTDCPIERRNYSWEQILGFIESEA